MFLQSWGLGMGTDAVDADGTTRESGEYQSLTKVLSSLESQHAVGTCSESLTTSSNVTAAWLLGAGKQQG